MNGNCMLLHRLGAATTACRLSSEPPGPGSTTSVLPLPQCCMESPTSAINVGFYINVAPLGRLTMPPPPHPLGAAQHCVQVHPAQAQGLHRLDTFLENHSVWNVVCFEFDELLCHAAMSRGYWAGCHKPGMHCENAIWIEVLQGVCGPCSVCVWPG